MLRSLFDRAVLATDLSSAWDEIVSCGGELRQLGCSQVILAHVIMEDGLAGPKKGVRQEAARRLAAQRGWLEDQGLQVMVETPVGLPGSSLNQVAQEYDASLIIIGSHGMTLWREGVLGSFSNAVLHNTRFPLLILPMQVLEEGPSCRSWLSGDLLRHLLMPTDFSQNAAEALCHLELLALRGVASATLLHALRVSPEEVPAGAVREEAEARARNFLEVLQGRLEAAGVLEVDTCLAFDHPVSAILELLRTADFSLIVLGTQGRGFLEEVYVGSVAHNISRFNLCPVLLIPPMLRQTQDGKRRIME